jgi:TatD DNase family protein
MKSYFFDAHTHLQFAAFKDDWREAVERALHANVWLVNVGTQRDTSRRAVEVAHEFSEGVFATVGLHPIHTEQSYHDAKELGADDMAREFTSRGEDFDYEFYKKLALDPKVVAIGECGFDYYRGKRTEDRGKQEKVFVQQIELAKDVGKPLMIHCREAFSDLIATLSSSRSSLSSPPGIIHFFSGTKEDAGRLLDMGFSFTFGGVITFARAYDEVIKYIPTDRILSETDAPYVTPEPYRGKRNEAAYVVYVVKKLAEIKGVSEEEIRNQIFTSAKNIFRITTES